MSGFSDIFYCKLYVKTSRKVGYLIDYSTVGVIMKTKINIQISPCLYALSVFIYLYNSPVGTRSMVWKANICMQIKKAINI